MCRVKASVYQSELRNKLFKRIESAAAVAIEKEKETWDIDPYGYYSVLFFKELY